MGGLLGGVYNGVFCLLLKLLGYPFTAGSDRVLQSSDGEAQP